LSRIRFVEPKDVRDLAVRIVERLTKDVGGSCGGRQLFQQQQHPKRQRLASFRTQPRVGAGIDWLQPGSNVRLSARARRLHDVDRQSPRCRHEECRCVPKPAAIGRLPAYPGRRRRAMREARVQLEAAHGVFERLGARPWMDRATGQTRPRARDNVLDRLTPQEFEIASLAASGLTNKQIAERLFLSHRTVGGHLHRAFPKLGVATRAALRDALGSLPPEQLPHK
jgi:DNA-binding CsgD family transcriptional regulator